MCILDLDWISIKTYTGEQTMVSESIFHGQSLLEIHCIFHCTTGIAYRPSCFLFYIFPGVSNTFAGEQDITQLT